MVPQVGLVSCVMKAFVCPEAPPALSLFTAKIITLFLCLASNRNALKVNRRKLGYRDRGSLVAPKDKNSQASRGKRARTWKSRETRAAQPLCHRHRSTVSLETHGCSSLVLFTPRLCLSVSPSLSLCFCLPLCLSHCRFAQLLNHGAGDGCSFVPKVFCPPSSSSNRICSVTSASIPKSQQKMSY